ncbi:12845_t:CDS:2 [Entrophospora sp. SA101]|nr:12845_t:CDS:2 [Entrophospora sp. SA101]CAJ0839089.1 14569_t:CDS:2 [Entrophospora sp. SA101]
MDSKVDSLFNLCKATIWKSRYFLDGVGSVPYRLIRTILMDFKPEKILEFEEKSPHLLKEQNAKFEKARAKLRASVAATVKEREARSIKMISFIPSKNRNAKKNLTPLQKLRKEMIKTNYNDNNKLKKYSMSVPITWLQREGGFKIYSHDSSSNTFSSAIKSISKSSQKLDLRYKPYPTIPRSNKSSISNLKIARATSQPYSINRPSTISPKLKSSSSSPTTTNPSTKFFGSKKAQLSTPPTNSLTKKVVSPVISSKSSSTIKHRVNLKQEKF